MNIKTIAVIIIENIAPITAILLAYKAYRQTRTISDEQIKQTQFINDEQIALSKKQAFITLYSQLQNLARVDPEDFEWQTIQGVHGVIDQINTLELIAVAWQKELVDRDILLNLYGKAFVEVYNDIHQINKVDDYDGRDGKHKLSYYAKTSNIVYVEIKKALEKRNE